MQLIASKIMLGHLNAYCSTKKGAPSFTPNGRERLARESLSLASKLNVLDQVAELNQVLESGEVDVLFIAARVSACRLGECFDSLGVSTSIRASIGGFIADFGYRLASGISIDEVLKDACWDAQSPGGVDTRRLADKLHQWFRHPSNPSAFVTPSKLKQLCTFADEFVREAEHIPFGSLASAISRKIDRPITLWPIRNGGTGTRAIRYTRKSEDELEEIIFYHPSDTCQSALDFVTRYTVAHELAHVALQHPPGDGESNMVEEVEAHCLAAVFMARHGAPTTRTPPNEDELKELLDSTDLADCDKEALLSQLGPILALDNGEDTVHSVLGVSAGVDADSRLSELTDLIARYENDADFRSAEIQRFQTAMDAVCGMSR